MPELIEQETDDGLTPVIVACQNGNAEELKELLENGASVKSIDKTGKNALHYCADNLETQCAEMLLMRDESILHVRDEQGFTPLHMAVIGGNVPLLKLLVRKGADVSILDAEGHTPAHWATVCTHLEILDVLIEQNAELSKCDSHNAYPIHYAAQMNGRDNGHTDSKIGEKVLKKLLDSGIPCDVLDKDRRQPLLWAASAGNSESCKLLVTAGADVNSVDKDGLTALHCAASRGHSDCVDKLKKLGAEVNVADTNGCTALFYAITLGNKECTKLLLKYGADPDHKDSRGRTPTHCGAIKGCLDTVKMLDKSKADLWYPSFRGDCPIHEAAQGGHCDVVKYLLRWKSSPDAVNIANDAGRTCLHIAAIVNNLPLCKLLLDENADKNPLMKNKDKVYTPYDAAIIKGNNEIADYIKSKGGDTGGDIDNLLIAKGIRKSKSAKSRQTLASHPEEEEPEDKKKAEEEEKKKKEAARKKKEKEDSEREKEKFVIVPSEKDKDKKGKGDKKDSEKEKGEKKGKGEKKASEDELKNLQDKIAAGQGDSDERGPNRKPIPVIEPTKEDAKKQKKSAKKDQTDEELEEAKRKIAEGQKEADERERKRKEAEEKEAAKKEKSEKEVKKGKDKKDLSDDELKALQDKIKAGEGDIDERDKKKTKPEKKSPEKKSAGKDKTDLTDKELAAAAAAIVAADEAKKQKQKQEKEELDSREKERLAKELKEKEKLAKELKEKEKLAKELQEKLTKESQEKEKLAKDKVKLTKELQEKDKLTKELQEKEKLTKELLEKEKLAKDKNKKEELDERTTKDGDDLDTGDSRGRSKKTPIEVATRKPAGSPQSRENIKSRRESPLKDRRSLKSSSTEREEFEFPDDAPENEVDALKRAEERRKSRERSRSGSTDRESEERPELRRFSKVGNDGRIQPGLLGEKNNRNRRLDERDSTSPIDSEDEFIDDPYFGRRIKYGNHRSLGSKRPDNREKVLRDKKRLEMSRTSNRTRNSGGVAKMVPLGFSRLETPQRPITRKSSSIQESVKRYQSERTFVRQLHQLKRAQIYTGPMHDIVLFSKMMNVYKNNTLNDSELDLESQYLDDWDSYLQDNLRFVSHYYEDDRTGLRDTAKEYHNHLEKSATDAKISVDNRIDHIIKKNEKQEATEKEESERLNKKINSLAEKTGSVLDNVRQKADESVLSARTLNTSLEEDMRRERHERLRNSKFTSKREKQWLLEQEAMDDRQMRHNEVDKGRKEKHKQWMRNKNEESRRSLQRVYGPTPVFDPVVSKRGQPNKTSTPKPTMNSSRTSSRPKSMASSISGSRSRPVDQELEVHMTEFGMRRVKTGLEGHSFAKMNARKSRSNLRPSSVLPANWTPKYDGLNLRPRAGLVFVEPAVYDEVLREEQMIRAGVTRNSTRNLTSLTLDTDNNMLETVDS